MSPIEIEAAARAEGETRNELEKDLYALLLLYFEKASKAALLGYVKDATPTVPERLIEALEGVLRSHGAKVGETFGLSDLNESLFPQWLDERAKESSQQISATTQKNVIAAIVLATKELVEAAEDSSRRSVARAAYAQVSRTFKSRAETGAITETTASSESSKFHTAEAATLHKKTWVTMNDGIVRATHVLANMQEVDFDATFTVGGYQMRFPADYSLGAPVKEIIHCRCMAIYTEGRK
ncbi:hypothetical protein [Pseudomonas arsenicoxydans]|uniref:Phage head morphogenesis domain-containing protein n=1 Tax=Pseudomonas arsenicoxydans TaxID=702115 RepID=A0A502HSK1_9PSED|nr:hypothetical protein [Pseudomonas arsenicoxydans]TPG76322.1 hypothetical protein EAH78_18335 [Pseudomonas arsenicoxydans]